MGHEVGLADVFAAHALFVIPVDRRLFLLRLCRDSRIVFAEPALDRQVISLVCPPNWLGTHAPRL